MSNKNVTVNFSGVFVWLLTLLFIGLKLTDHIDWSWWWVLSPLWIGFSLAVLTLGAIFALVIWAEK